jgi:hypothetical protein
VGRVGVSAYGRMGEGAKGVVGLRHEIAERRTPNATPQTRETPRRSLNSFPTVLNCGVSIFNVVKL